MSLFEASISVLEMQAQSDFFYMRINNCPLNSPARPSYFGHSKNLMSDMIDFSVKVSMILANEFYLHLPYMSALFHSLPMSGQPPSVLEPHAKPSLDYGCSLVETFDKELRVGISKDSIENLSEHSI